jgi:hypothetical protein
MTTRYEVGHESTVPSHASKDTTARSLTISQAQIQDEPLERPNLTKIFFTTLGWGSRRHLQLSYMVKRERLG